MAENAPVKLIVDDEAAACLAAALKLQGFFPEFTKDQVRGVFPHSDLSLYPPGWRLINQGDEGRDLFVVYAGKVTVIRAFAAQEFTLGPGQFFGEIGLVRDGRRTANVLAAAESKIFRLVYQDLQYLMANNPELDVHLREIAESRL